jgi:tetratricopeptide (TPR) repeat protein
VKLGCALLAALSLSLGAHELRADDEERASRLFQRGAAEYSSGRLVEAAEAFEAAFELSPRGATIYNAGLAWLEVGRRVQAALAFERALAAGDMIDPQLADATHRLSVLRRVLGRVRVEAPSGRVSIGSVKQALVPITVWLEPGTHRAELSTGDSLRHQSVKVGAGELQTLRFASEPAEPGPRVPDASAPASSSSRKPWGFVALGAAAAAAGAAIVIGSEGIEARDRFEGSRRQDADARDRAVTLRVWANVAWGVALIGAGTGAYLLLSPEPAATAGVLPRGVVLSGEF